MGNNKCLFGKIGMSGKVGILMELQVQPPIFTELWVINMLNLVLLNE